MFDPIYKDDCCLALCKLPVSILRIVKSKCVVVFSLLISLRRSETGLQIISVMNLESTNHIIIYKNQLLK